MIDSLYKILHIPGEQLKLAAALELMLFNFDFHFPCMCFLVDREFNIFGRSSVTKYEKQSPIKIYLAMNSHIVYYFTIC